MEEEVDSQDKTMKRSLPSSTCLPLEFLNFLPTAFFVIMIMILSWFIEGCCNSLKVRCVPLSTPWTAIAIRGKEKS